MYFICMTSDAILRYVGAFCKGAKHLGGGGLLAQNTETKDFFQVTN
jgi:hypothetical protein